MPRKLPGRIYRPRYTYQGERRMVSTLWIDYRDSNGDRKRESADTDDYGEAERYLATKLAEARAGEPDADVPFETLCRLIREDYEANGHRSSIERRIAHLEPFFEGKMASEIDSAAIKRYVASRRSDKKKDGGKYAPATINRELSTLRRMLRLGREHGMVGSVPTISPAMLKERNIRTGFLDPDAFDKLLAALPPRLKPLVEAGYLTGWRKSELLSRNWSHVDFKDGWLRLEPGETKSGDGRQFPLIPSLRDVLERQRERKREVESTYGVEIEALFFYYEPSRNGLPAGRRIATFRRSWRTATKAAGCPDLLFHDMRRSAVRNSVRAGIPEHVARAYSGHKTTAVFERYDILDERTLREQAEKLTAYLSERRQEPAQNEEVKSS